MSRAARWLLRRLWALQRRLERARAHAWAEDARRRLGACGEGVHLSAFSTFVHPERIRLGDNVHIGRNAWFRGDGGIEIGANTHISRNVVVLSASHDYEGSRLPYDERFVTRRVRIGRNVWIGMNAMVVPGVSVGDGAVVAMGTVVVEDVPPLAVVGGTGQRVLKYRDRERYERLEREGRYGGRGGKALP